MRCPQCPRGVLMFGTENGRAFEECRDCGYHTRIVARPAPPLVTQRGPYKQLPPLRVREREDTP